MEQLDALPSTTTTHLVTIQNAVAYGVGMLEAQLGLRLVERSGREPRLTRHGEAIVAAASAVGD